MTTIIPDIQKILREIVDPRNQKYSDEDLHQISISNKKTISFLATAFYDGNTTIQEVKSKIPFDLYVQFLECYAMGKFDT